MSYKIVLSGGEWRLFFLFAVVGFFTILIGAGLGLIWLMNHVTIAP